MHRCFSHLRPIMLDDLGLVPAVQWLSQGIRQRYGLDCTLVVEPADFDLDEPDATTAYRIIQESLTNFARRARACAVVIAESAAQMLPQHPRQISTTLSQANAGFSMRARRRLI